MRSCSETKTLVEAMLEETRRRGGWGADSWRLVRSEKCVRPVPAEKKRVGGAMRTASLMVLGARTSSDKAGSM